jgi:hypothetical protein
MRSRSIVHVCAGLGLAYLLTASPAEAQILDDPPTGESYYVEGFGGLWNPAADMSISSEGGDGLRGILGSAIDFKRDLALSDHRLPELRLVLRPARKHKFRFQSIPIKYEEGPVTVVRDLVFNGQLYNTGLPINWLLDWRAYRFGYEYDFIVGNWGFAGFILEAKYTDVRAELESPVTDEFMQRAAPIPALGGIVRVYVVPNISITGEVSGVKVPDGVSENFKAHYADIDIYGTLNVTNNFGAQVGYRSIDVGYLIKEDTGSFVLRGVYFGAVGRF